MSEVTMSYDELYAIGDMEKILEKVKIHCEKKIKGQKFIDQNYLGLDADDIIQEVVIKVYRKLHMYDKAKGRVSTFIDHMIDNKIIDCIRGANSRAQFFANSVSIDTASVYDSESETRETILEPAIEETNYSFIELLADAEANFRFTDREKTVFKLRASGYDFPEIAKILGISRGRVYQIWKEVAKKIKEAL